MTYSSLNLDRVTDCCLKALFQRANALLHDVYGIFRMLPPKDGDGGGGNFVAALALLCIIDGLANAVWPTKDGVLDQETRFKKLIVSKLRWGPEGKDKWVDKGNAADQLYTEFRNSLVHDLAQDRPSSSRPKGYKEPVIGTWGKIPEKNRTIAEIDAMTVWNDDWPIFYVDRAKQKEPKYKLSGVALYWAVKNMTEKMLRDKST